jgi:hypothetical protein
MRHHRAAAILCAIALTGAWAAPARATRPAEDNAFAGTFSCPVHDTFNTDPDGSPNVLGRLQGGDVDFTTIGQCYTDTNVIDQEVLYVTFMTARRVEGRSDVVQTVMMHVVVLQEDLTGDAEFEVLKEGIAPDAGGAVATVDTVLVDVETNENVGDIITAAEGRSGSITIKGTPEAGGTIQGSLDIRVTDMTKGSSELGYPCLLSSECNVNNSLFCLIYQGDPTGMCGTF